MNEHFMSGYVKSPTIGIGKEVPAQNVGNCSRCEVPVLVNYSMTRVPLCPSCWTSMEAALTQVQGRGIYFG